MAGQEMFLRGKLCVSILLALPLAGMALAQNYPAKLVKFIVTYPPGGSSDVMARIIGAQLSEYWGQ